MKLNKSGKTFRVPQGLRELLKKIPKKKCRTGRRGKTSKAAFLLPCALLLCAAILCGCGEGVILSAGFSDNVIFEVEGDEFDRSEMKLYLLALQKEYETKYGSDVWDTSPEMAAVMRENALARAVRTASLYCMARAENIGLTEEEQSQISEISEMFEEELNEPDRSWLGVTTEKIRQSYERYALAEKMYHIVLSETDPEISDDEARTVQVESILIRVDNEEERMKAISQAERCLSELQSGSDFSAVAGKYSEDSTLLYGIARGEEEPAVEEAVFNLSEGEISGLIEVRDGYRIYKCISTSDREETDANRLKLLDQRRQEAFEARYETFTASLDYVLSEKNWAQMAVCRDPDVTAGNFFELFEENFTETD